MREHETHHASADLPHHEHWGTCMTLIVGTRKCRTLLLAPTVVCIVDFNRSTWLCDHVEGIRCSILGRASEVIVMIKQAQTPKNPQGLSKRELIYHQGWMPEQNCRSAIHDHHANHACDAWTFYDSLWTLHRLSYPLLSWVLQKFPFPRLVCAFYGSSWTLPESEFQ